MAKADFSVARKRCEHLLSQLDLDPPVTLQDLVAAVGHYRQRTITLTPAVLPARGAFGMTGGDEYGDVVLFQRDTSPSHQLLIILHELAHILANHPRKLVAVSDTAIRAASSKLTSLSEDMLHLVLGDDGDQSSPAQQALATARPSLLDELRTAASSPDAPPPEVDPYTAPEALYEQEDEWEAETMATLMLSWVSQQERGHTLNGPGSRLRASLGEPGDTF